MAVPTLRCHRSAVNVAVSPPARVPEVMVGMAAATRGAVVGLRVGGGGDGDRPGGDHAGRVGGEGDRVVVARLPSMTEPAGGEGLAGADVAACRRSG